MTQLSNDIKWNKIKAIEKQLSKLYYDYWSGHGFGEDAHKIAKREVWILANRIYNIATEGSKPVDNLYGYGNTALTKEKVMYYVNELPSHIYSGDLAYCINSRDFFWEMYEYTNS